MRKTKGSYKKTENAPGLYQLYLYFAGQNPRTDLAIANVKKLCYERLARRCKLKLIDLYKNPALAKSDQIVASPTLIKKLPLPERRVVGDLSDMGRVFLGLQIS